MCAAIVKSLAYLHAFNISHRDIKSANVLLKETGEVKIGIYIFFLFFFYFFLFIFYLFL